MHSNQKTEEAEALTKKKTKLGIRLFFIYLILYAGFVVIGVFQYELLSINIIAGMNLALIYGIGLIVFAVVLGIVYNYYCTKYEDGEALKQNKEGGQQ